MIYYHIMNPKKIVEGNFKINIQNISNLEDFPWKDNIKNREELETKLENKESIPFIFSDFVVLLMNNDKKKLIKDTYTMLKNAEIMFKNLLNNIETDYDIDDEIVEIKESI